MIYFVDEYSGFGTINFVEKFIKVRQNIEKYIAKPQMQRNDRVKLLKVEIEYEYMKDIHELISLSLIEESVPLVFSLISPTSRVRWKEKYCNKLMSIVDMMYLKTSLPHSFWDYDHTSYILNHTSISSQ